MKTIRKGTFETNSSSCHSVTFMSKADWEDFKGHKTILSKESFPTECHKSIITDLRGYGREGIYSVPKIVNTLKKALNDLNVNQFVFRYKDIDFAEGMVTYHILDFLKQNFDEQLFIKVYNYEDSTKYPLPKPVTLHFKWSNKEEVIDYFDNSSIRDILDRLSTDMPSEFYLYGNEEWDDVHTKVYEHSDEDFVILDRYESC